jgi:NADH dehydrogenase
MVANNHGSTHRVAVIGSGFGGLAAARSLARVEVEVTLISRTSHHLFQPLLYQVATGVLSEGEIAPSTRDVLRRQRNAHVVLGKVVDIDLARRQVYSRTVLGTTVTPYDSLVVAAGAGQSYFGNPQFAEFAPGMKTIDDALELRGRIFGAFELAELAPDERERERLMTFVVVGAGPTGVEMAGQIAELAHRTLVGAFRDLDTRTARILLVDGAEHVLPMFAPSLSLAAEAQLRDIGVTLHLGSRVVDVSARQVTLVGPDGAAETLPSGTCIWAAGVEASPLARLLAEQTGASLDRAGRIAVGADLTLPGHPEVYVVGDMMSLDALPGVAQVAIQGGRHAAASIRTRLDAPGAPVAPFRYRNKGSMATISRFHAVAEMGRVRLRGPAAWGIWLGVHLAYLVGFGNRAAAVFHWTVSFLGRRRSQRTSSYQQVFGRLALELAGREVAARARGEVAAGDAGDDAQPAAS